MVQRVASVTVDENDQEGFVLRAWLLAKVACAVSSDSAVQECARITEDPTLYKQNLNEMSAFALTKTNFDLVSQALVGVFQGAIYSLAPEQVQGIHELLVDLGSALALSENPAAGAQQILQTFSTPERQNLLAQFRANNSLSGQFPLVQQMLAWLTHPALSSTIRFQTPISFSTRGRLECWTVKQGQLRCLNSSGPDPEAFAIPQNVRNLNVDRLFVHDNGAYSQGSEVCVQSGERLYCWGGVISLLQGERTKACELPLPHPMSNDEIGRYNDFHQYEGQVSSGAMSVRGRCLGKFITIELGARSIFGVTPDDDGRLFLPDHATDPIAIPFGAHDLTVFNGRLYYIDAHHVLHWVKRYTQADEDGDFFYDFPNQNVEKIKSLGSSLCAQFSDEGWTCRTLVAGGYQKNASFYNRLLPDGEVNDDSGILISATPEKMQFAEFRYHDARQTGTGESPRLSGAAQTLLLGNNLTPFESCNLVQKKIVCLGKQDHQPLASALDQLKNVRQLGFVGNQICAMQESNVLVCLDYVQLNKKPQPSAIHRLDLNRAQPSSSYDFKMGSYSNYKTKPGTIWNFRDHWLWGQAPGDSQVLLVSTESQWSDFSDRMADHYVFRSAGTPSKTSGAGGCVEAQDRITCFSRSFRTPDDEQDVPEVYMLNRAIDPNTPLPARRDR